MSDLDMFLVTIAVVGIAATIAFVQREARLNREQRRGPIKIGNEDEGL
jgi:hypothetical protein